MMKIANVRLCDKRLTVLTNYSHHIKCLTIDVVVARDICQEEKMNKSVLHTNIDWDGIVANGQIWKTYSFEFRQCHFLCSYSIILPSPRRVAASWLGNVACRTSDPSRCRSSAGQMLRNFSILALLESCTGEALVLFESKNMSLRWKQQTVFLFNITTVKYLGIFLW